MDNQLILIEEMKQLGLTQYEVKAYLNLLEEWPVNGYTLSKNSGVPRSRIYEVLNNLIKKQFVFEKNTENGILYYPLEPELLIQKLKKNYESIIKHVEDETTHLFTRSKDQYESKVINGRKNIFDFIDLLLTNAQKRIDISIWEEEYSDLEQSFSNAIKRGIKVKGVYFGYDNKFTDVLTHRRLKTYLDEKEERYIIIIIDQAEAVTGIISRGEESQVTWTNDYGVIDIMEDYIVHDLMVNEYSRSLSDVERKKYELATDTVRKNFLKIKGVLEMTYVPNYEEALKLLKKYNSLDFHILHGQVVGGVMKYFAQKHDPDNADFWEIVGLLHDLDFGMYPEEHCVKQVELMRSHKIDERLIRSTISHGYGITKTNVKPENMMEKILFTIDELTGIIYAAALMRPSKSVSDMQMKSVKKKFKDKAFAAGCSRETIKLGAENLGWELSYLFEETLIAMKSLVVKLDI